MGLHTSLKPAFGNTVHDVNPVPSFTVILQLNLIIHIHLLPTHPLINFTTPLITYNLPVTLSYRVIIKGEEHEKYALNVMEMVDGGMGNLVGELM